MTRSVHVRGRIAVLQDMVEQAVAAFQAEEDEAFKNALVVAKSLIDTISQEAGVKLE